MSVTLYTEADLLNIPPLQWLIDQMLPLGGAGMIHGPPGAGKSFLALHVAAAITLGWPIFGHPVQQGRAVYLYAEGRAGLRERVLAWKAHHHVEALPAIYFIPHAVQVARSNDYIELVEALHTVTPIVLLILDTQARVTVGLKENDPTEMGLFVAAIDRLRDKIGCAVLIVHHDMKRPEPGVAAERGGTAVWGAIDVKMRLTERKGSRVLTCEKQRDADPFPTISLKLIPHLGSAVMTETDRELARQRAKVEGGTVEAARWRVRRKQKGGVT